MVENNKPGFRPFSMPSEPIVSTVPVPQPQSLTIEQALMIASQHQEAGRLQEAETILRQILQVQPNNAHALHSLGIVAHMAGRTDLAADFVEQAIKCNDKIAIFHANRAEMCRLLGRLDESITHGQKAVALDKKMVMAHSNLGIAYFDKGDDVRAESAQKAAINLDPNFAPALNNLGSIYRNRKDDDKALVFYHRALKANPEYLASYNNLGETLVRRDQPEQALDILNQALAKNQRYPEAQCNKGYALLGIGEEAQAMTCFNFALQLRPDYPEAFVGVGRVHNEMQNYKEAERAVKQAIALKPDMAEAHSVLGSVYLSEGQTEKAKETFRKALSFDPELNSAELGLGNILLEEGHLEESEKLFSRLLTSKSERISALFSLVQTRKMRADDEAIGMLEEEALRLNELPDSKQTYIHYALGKVYDDLKMPDKSFPHFLEGARIKRKKIHYDAKDKEKVFARIQSLFSPEFFDRVKGNGNSSDVPVFILGMPRSGTTLTEQIISSHPDVFGAGELFEMLNISKGNSSFPDYIERVTSDIITKMGNEYVEKVMARAPGSKRITDKMPANFLNVGLIHAALPKAKIIHVMRNPLDTCISCFTRLFAHNQDYTYELNELGQFYKGYHDLMQHWERVLPKGSFMNIQYEDIVADTEGQARKLIEYCELPWNESCLDFHKNERNIRTASVAQVRQPIYKSSVARWKAYEQYLGPLIEGLGHAYKHES